MTTKNVRIGEGRAIALIAGFGYLTKTRQLAITQPDSETNSDS
jgi:hypothetical protein